MEIQQIAYHIAWHFASYHPDTFERPKFTLESATGILGVEDELKEDRKR